VRETWQGKLKHGPSSIEVGRLEKGFPCYHTAHEAILNWLLCA